MVTVMLCALLLLCLLLMVLQVQTPGELLGAGNSALEPHGHLVSSSLTSHKAQEPVQVLGKAEPMCPYAISIRIPLFLFKIHDFSPS